MKKVYFFICVLISISCISFQLDAQTTDAKSEIAKIKADWIEVSDISAILSHAKTTGRGVFLIDADEVIFTSSANPDGSVSLVRLYSELEALFFAIRNNGHKVYILTYNKAAEIRRKLAKVGLNESCFDGILACEMRGNVLTSKGDLLRKHLAALSLPYDFAVFIDNFPPFVRNVQAVGKEFGLPLHSYLCTGYIPLYHQFVYSHLSSLCRTSIKTSEKTIELIRIQKSLLKYGIDITKFLEQYPDFESFRKFAVDQALIWPYLVYL